jgi:hypothetical protein
MRLQIYSVNIKTYHHGISGTVAFNPGDDFNKYQQAFLAALPGMALVKRIY